MDGTQARLKQAQLFLPLPQSQGGKGGWDSGEIETNSDQPVGGVKLSGKGGWDSGEIETYHCFPEVAPDTPRGKGGWDSGEIETMERLLQFGCHQWWKGWMGLRRD